MGQAGRREGGGPRDRGRRGPSMVGARARDRARDRDRDSRARCLGRPVSSTCCQLPTWPQRLHRSVRSQDTWLAHCLLHEHASIGQTKVLVPTTIGKHLTAPIYVINATIFSAICVSNSSHQHLNVYLVKLTQALSLHFLLLLEVRGFSGVHNIFVKPEIRLDPSSVNTKTF